MLTVDDALPQYKHLEGLDSFKPFFNEVSLEPHEGDGEFTLKYPFLNRFVQYPISSGSLDAIQTPEELSAFLRTGHMQVFIDEVLRPTNVGAYNLTDDFTLP